MTKEKEHRKGANIKSKFVTRRENIEDVQKDSVLLEQALSEYQEIVSSNHQVNPHE